MRMPHNYDRITSPNLFKTPRIVICVGYPDQLDMAMTVLHIISIFTTGAALALWIYVTFSRNYTERNIPVCLVLTFTVIAGIDFVSHLSYVDMKY